MPLGITAFKMAHVLVLATVFIYLIIFVAAAESSFCTSRSGASQSELSFLHFVHIMTSEIYLCSAKYLYADLILIK